MATEREIAIGLAKDPQFKKLPADRQMAVFKAAVDRSSAAGDRITEAIGPGPTQVERARALTEERIAERPSLIQEFGRMERPETLGELGIAGLTGLGAGFEALESLPANVALAIQAGELGELPEELLAGLRGERPAQLGDVFRASGVPGLSEEPIAVAGGLLAASPLGGPVGAGVRGLARAATAGRAAQKALSAGRIAKRSAEKKIARTITGSSGFRQTAKVQEGLRKFIGGLSPEYGRRFNSIIEKAGKSKQSVIPSDDISGATGRALREHGIIDDTGQLLVDESALSRAEKRAVQMFDEFSSSETGVTVADAAEKSKELFRLLKAQTRTGTKEATAADSLVLDFRNAISNSLEGQVKGIKDLNKWYAQRKRFFRDANAIFKPFQREAGSRRGTSVLNNINKADEATISVLKDIEAETGIKILKEAKRAASGFARIRRAGERTILGPVAEAGLGVVEATGALQPPAVFGLAGAREVLTDEDLE